MSEQIKELGSKEVREIVNNFKGKFNEIGISMSTLTAIHILIPDGIQVLKDQFESAFCLPEDITTMIHGDLVIFELDCIRCVIECGSLGKSPVGAPNVSESGTTLIAIPTFKTKEDEEKFNKALTASMSDGHENEIPEPKRRSKIAFFVEGVVRVSRIIAQGFIMAFLLIRLFTTQFIVPPYIVGILASLVILSYMIMR